MLTERKGTDNYMAPEVYAGLEYNGDEADAFSLGVLLFSIVMC